VADGRILLELKGVSKSFGATKVLEQIDLAVRDGEFITILGPSGSGKTTILRMIGGFTQPSAGQILLDGKDIAREPINRRPFNTVFQDYALFPHMTVAGNVGYGLKVRGTARAVVEKRVTETLDLVQLGAFRDRYPAQLSGGQRQRVALARAIICEPRLILLDEPLAALDKKLRQQTQFELMRIQEKVGITFVLVTHDQEEAMTMASRIAVMDRGRIAQVGTPNEIYEYPNSRFVADFIGSVNMFEGRLVEDAPDHVVIAAPALGGTIYVDHGVAAAPGATVWVAIRPEQVRIGRAQPASMHNFARGMVRDIGYLGDVSTYHIELPSGATMQATMPNLARLAEPAVAWDEQVWLSWDAANAVVLTS